ncbi:MAG: hypothetical protein FWG38_03075 [Defluviitaleaceae bacterium]|nr:hypothetical protein [Defluviitaleaceae bacterium]
MSKLSTKRVNIIVLVISFVVIKVGFYHAVMFDMSRQWAAEFYERHSHLAGVGGVRGLDAYDMQHLTLTIVFFVTGFLIYLATNKKMVPKRHYMLVLLALTSLVGSFGFSQGLDGSRTWHFSGFALIVAECAFALFEHVKLLKKRKTIDEPMQAASENYEEAVS